MVVSGTGFGEGLARVATVSQAAPLHRTILWRVTGDIAAAIYHCDIRSRASIASQTAAQLGPGL